MPADSALTAMVKRPSPHLRRYAQASRKIRIYIIRQPRYRKKAKKQQHTATEKAAAVERQREVRTRINDFIEKALKVVWTEAEKISEEFAHLGHKPQHWYSMLLQQDRRKKSKRKISRWQAFVSEYSRQCNEGECLLLVLASISDPPRYVAFPGDADRLRIAIYSKDLGER